MCGSIYGLISGSTGNDKKTRTVWEENIEWNLFFCSVFDQTVFGDLHILL
jgi:hypothetical protein